MAPRAAPTRMPIRVVGAVTHEADRAVALDGVVAKLAEDLVVVRAAGDVVVAELVQIVTLVGVNGLGFGVVIQ